MRKQSRQGIVRAVIVTALATALSPLAACGDAAEEPEVLPRSMPLVQRPDVERIPAPLPAGFCEIDVDGIGAVDIENDYLPNVVRCENGGANLEALKAQAIAARSVAYYSIETSGGICDSQMCQVYSCPGSPDAIHRQAVEETSGLYLANNSTLTYGFYVAGDPDVAPPACVGVSGPTENWVTYNEGRTGTDVDQTGLGTVHDPGDAGFGQNRGCMSQWGARCLENNNDYDYVAILRFFYGDDIEIVQAEAECIDPVDPTESGTSGGMGESSGGPELTTGDPTSVSTTGDSGGASASTSAEVGSDSMSTTTPDEGGAEAGVGTNGAEAGGDEDSAGMSGGTGLDSVSGALPQNFGGDSGDGCGCQATSSDAPAWWFLGIFGLVLRRRRRRALPPRS